MERFLSLRMIIGRALVLSLTLATGSGWGAEPTEEFVGPFPSWRNVRRDYGARGDGRADDTAAIQRALDELTKHADSCVLYFPAGVYRITGTLTTVRKAHTDCQGVAVIGEDPSSTVLRWDGEDDGTMFRWDAWYSKLSRLTFDGARSAGTALAYGPAFSTYNETSDLIFRDAANGLVFGGPQTAGQAENTVLRCQFIRCGTGIQTVNWNSMDIWVWYGRFEDCGRGVHNVMGNWHVWESLFLRSRQADLSSVNLMAFSVVNNTSIGSRCFFDFSTGHTWGSPVSLTGNRVLDPTGDWAVMLDNAGPYLVVDNQFRLLGPTRGIRMTWADQTLVGNVYSKTDAVEERGRFRRLEEKVVSSDEISGSLPTLPPTPPRRERTVFEVPAGAGGDTIQQVIDEAAKLSGRRPVVHLPMARYRIEKTLVIPRGCDLQLVGDSAGETGARLDWAGADDGVVLRVAGPSRATLRDFYIHAGKARALLVEDCDQPQGRIFADQLNVNGPADRAADASALRIDGLDRTDVLLRSLQGSGNGGHWVEVAGGPDAERATNQASIFTGATGSAAGQYDVSRGGRLVVRSVYHERSSDSLNGLHLTGHGTLSIDATRFSYATSPTSPTIAADDFRGLFTLATCILMPVETSTSCRFELRGDGRSASVLALNNQFWIRQKTVADDVWSNVARPPARGGLIGCNVNTSNKEAAPRGFEFLANVGDHPDPAKSASGAGPLENRGTVDDATLVRHLAPLRTARVWLQDASVPANATDLGIYRVMAGGGRGGVVSFGRSAHPAGQRSVDRPVDPASAGTARSSGPLFLGKPLDYWLSQAGQAETAENFDRIVEALSQAVQSEDNSAKVAAADALGALGPAAMAAMPVLLDQLDHIQPWVREAAMGALASFGKDAVPALIDTFKTDASVRIRIAFTLGAMGAEAREAIPVLVEAMERESPVNQIRLAGILTQIDPERYPDATGRHAVPDRVQLSPASEGEFSIADWPQFHGPGRDSICRERGLLGRWPEDGPKLLWNIEGLGRGLSSVSIAGGRAFTMGDRSVDAGQEAQFVIALDLETHRELWATRVGPPFETGPRCTPTVDGDLLYALGSEGDLVCLRTATGEVCWRKNLGADFGGQMMSGWKFSESPLVDGERLICTPGAADAMMAALDKRTGRTIWKAAVPKLGEKGADGAAYSSAVAAEIAGVRQYVQLVGRGAIGVDAATGRFLWGYNRVANNVANITAPVVRGNCVFVTTAYNTGSALLEVKREGDGFRADEVYFLGPREFVNHHGGVVLVGEHLYGGHGANQGNPTCLALATGKICWQSRSPARGSACVLYADGHLIFRYDRGDVVLVEASPEEFRVKGRFRPPTGAGPAWAHPVIHRGKLYLRHDDLLCCYDVRAYD